MLTYTILLKCLFKCTPVLDDGTSVVEYAKLKKNQAELSSFSYRHCGGQNCGYYTRQRIICHDVQ